MVLINGTKFSCETCIKGHRTSSCKHTDRQLVEIKKKGRPQTQCEHCRELRKTKQMHVKCLCSPSKGGAHLVPSSDASPNSESPQPSPVIPECAQGPECPCCIPRKRPPTKRNTNKAHPTSHGVELELAPNISRKTTSSFDSGYRPDEVSVSTQGSLRPCHDPSLGSNHAHVHAPSFSPYHHAYGAHRGQEGQVTRPLTHVEPGSDTTPPYDLSQSDFDPSSLDGLFGTYPMELLAQTLDKPVVADDHNLDLTTLDQVSFMEFLTNGSPSSNGSMEPTSSLGSSSEEDFTTFFESLSGPSTPPDVLSTGNQPRIFDSLNEPILGLNPTWMASEDSNWLAAPAVVSAET